MVKTTQLVSNMNLLRVGCIDLRIHISLSLYIYIYILQTHLILLLPPGCNCNVADYCAVRGVAHHTASSRVLKCSPEFMLRNGGPRAMQPKQVRSKLAVPGFVLDRKNGVA